MWATSGSVFYGYMVDKVPKDAKLLANMREACHVILYNVANSNGINGLSATAHVVSVTPYWEKLAYALIAVLAIADAVAAFLPAERRDCFRFAPVVPVVIGVGVENRPVIVAAADLLKRHDQSPVRKTRRFGVKHGLLAKSGRENGLKLNLHG